MATILWACNAECTPANFHNTLGGGAQPTLSTEQANQATHSYKHSTAGTASSHYTNSAIAVSAIFVWRFYIYFTVLPSADTMLASPPTSGLSGVAFKQSDSKIYASSNGTLGATGVAVTTGQWYRIDVRANLNAGGNTQTAEAQVDGVAVGTATGTFIAAQTSTGVRIGPNITVTHTLYTDSLVISETSADYPIGATLFVFEGFPPGGKSGNAPGRSRGNPNPGKPGGNPGGGGQDPFNSVFAWRRKQRSRNF